jgi:hypothetical protein
MHYDSLKGVGFHASEASHVELTISINGEASKGDIRISLENVSGLYQNQLIVYYDGEEYYSNVIASIVDNAVNLIYPLEADLAINDTVHNFYINSSHPNKYGYRAIVDDAVRSLSKMRSEKRFLKTFDKGVHLLLGDSWFALELASPYLQSRLKERLPNATFINFGVGGNQIDNLLRRFKGTATDTDVNDDLKRYGDRKNVTLIPEIDFVWVMSGTNDYIAQTTSTDFKGSMDELMKEIIKRGAKPLIFTASVGQVGVGTNFTLSKEYADQVRVINFTGFIAK